MSPEELPQARQREPHGRLDHRHVDHLALAGARSLVERREDADDAPQAPAEVGQLETRHLGRRAGRSLHAEHTGTREVVDVVPGASGHRPVLPVPRQRAHDEARVRGEERRVAETEPLEHPGTELLEEDVVPRSPS